MLHKLTLILFVMVVSLPLYAREIAGISVAEDIMLEGTQLHLNGAGIRTKFFFNIYIGSLYTPDKATTPEAVYTMPGSKQIGMHILYSEINREKLVNGWNEGFAANLSSTEKSAMNKRIEQFNAAFGSVRQGDEIRLDLLADKTTQVWIKGTLKATIPGADFQQALLKIWLGNEPADSDLKEAMLGGS